MQNQSLSWLDRNEYPFSPHYFSIHGQQVHYIDEGKGDILLFVHGTPSWSFDFRYQIKHLSASYRCIALDHMGFGLSDKPKNYDYSTPNHAATLEKLIQHLNLKNITLVVHDFGGVIGFDYALKYPANIKKLVVLNAWLWDASDEPEFKKMKPILKSPFLPFLYKRLNFSPKFLLPKSFFNPKNLSKKIRRHYTAPFASAKERNGTLAFAKSLLHDQAWFETLWKQVERLKEKPILFIWGMNDSFVLPKYLRTFSAAFANAKVVELEECGHFPQEEKREEVLEAMKGFL